MQMLVANTELFQLRIEPDHPEIGVYLCAFRESKCIRDTLQNSVAICKQIALEDYGVTEDQWHEEEAEPS